MGRHRAVPPPRNTAEGSLLAWGIFTSLTTGVTMAVNRIPPALCATVGAATLVLFASVWLAARRSPRGGGRHSAQAPTTQTATSAPKRAGETGMAASRWTRTFGPPDTGSLPVLKYLEGAAAPLLANPDLDGMKQMSHSSL